MKKNPPSSRGLSKRKFPKGVANHAPKPKKARKDSSMAKREVEVIQIDDSFPSPEIDGTPLRPIYCLKNRGQIDDAEEKEECFILEFDPYDDCEKLNASSCGGDDDLHVVSEKGQVACRDYPHPRNACAKYPFQKTSHDRYCKMCYCYVCDLSAPCSEWLGSSGHCHAFNNKAWNNSRKAKKR